MNLDPASTPAHVTAELTIRLITDGALVVSRAERGANPVWSSVPP